jgi:hypothetical protein
MAGFKVISVWPVLGDYRGQDHVAENAVCVNTVASWRVRSDGEGCLKRLFVDFHNGWTFDSDHWLGRADAPARLLAALRSAYFGECGQGL